MKRNSSQLHLVSVIIPCYNYGWLLSETIDSVLAQTYTNWECIIIDDGSTDDTKIVAEKYCKKDPRITYVYQSNKGMSAARNNGIKSAKGEYLQFLDADDLLVSKKLEVQTNFLNEHPKASLIYGDVRFFRHGAPDILSRSMDMTDTPWMSKVEGNGVDVLERLIVKNEMVMNAPLIRANLLTKTGGFSETMRSMEDWDFWVRCAITGATFYYDDTPAMWSLVRVHAGSTSQNQARMIAFEGHVREQLNKLLLPMHNQKILDINRRAILSIKQYNAMYNVKHGRVMTGLRQFWELAHMSGNYLQYMRDAFYCLRNRLPEEGN